MNKQKTNVLIFGATGMLGSAVTKQLLKDDTLEVTALCRESSDGVLEQYCPGNQIAYFDAYEGAMDEAIAEMAGQQELPEGYIINCLGTIKPNVEKDIASAIYINSVLPWKIVELAKLTKSKLIHITTDCVFSGKKGKYTETDAHDVDDIYGRSKSLGEPTKDCMVLRTSIIGPEVHNHSSLIAWVQKEAASQNDGPKAINGYINHLWNGITTDTYAKVVRQIIREDLWIEGVRHIHSPNIVNKRQLVSLIAKAFGIDNKLTISEAYAPTSVDRTLSTNFPQFQEQFNIPSIQQQLNEYRDTISN